MTGIVHYQHPKAETIFCDGAPPWDGWTLHEGDRITTDIEEYLQAGDDRCYPCMKAFNRVAERAVLTRYFCPHCHPKARRAVPTLCRKHTVILCNGPDVLQCKICYAAPADGGYASCADCRTKIEANTKRRQGTDVSTTP